jgi:hypothetical protein
VVRKIISWGIRVVALLALLSSVSINARGQSCTVTVSDVTDNPALSGSAFLGTYTISGGGDGLYGGSTQKSHSGLNVASTTVTGNFTEIFEVTGLGSATGAFGGITAMEYGTYNNLTDTNKAFAFGVLLNAGNYDLVIQSVTELSSSRWGGGGTVYSQPVTYAFPFYIQISRSGNTYTFSQSSNGTSYSTVTTATTTGGSINPTLVGIAAWAGNTTSGSFGTMTGQNFTVNGSVPSLTDADMWTTGGNVGSEGPEVQAGTLNDGHYFVSGAVTLSSGCPPNATLDYINFTSLTDNTLGTEPWAYSVFGSETCISGSCVPYTNLEVPAAANNPYSATLIHGHSYTLTTNDYASYAGNYTSNIVVRNYELNP